MSRPSGLDPGLFRPEAIDPETLAFNAQLEKSLAAVPPIYTLEPQTIRDAREAGKGVFGPIIRSPMAVERSISGSGGAVAVRVFLPETVRGVYLHLHGG